MNLDELRTVQSKERSKDSLQHLRESFYADVADYVADLRERRDRAAERADNPFDDPEVNRLTDEIQTAEEVVEAIYERRVGKVVKRASLAAAGMPADEEGLTSEEQELFTELVERIETNKQEVLDVLAGEDAGGASTPAKPSAESTAASTGASAPGDATGDTSVPGDAPTPSEGVGASGGGSDSTDDVSAADVMGGGDATDSATSTTPSTAEEGDSRPATAEAAAVAGSSAEDSQAGSGSETAAPDDADNPLAGLEERTTVRVTSDVGEIFGVDERTYDLASEDVVTLPEANAEPLLERGAAEKLE